MSTASASRRRRRASARPAAASSTPRTCCPGRLPTPETPRRPALQPPAAATPILTRAVAQLETEDGWVGLGAVGQRLAIIASDFDPRTYGYGKLSDLVRKTGAFDVDQPDGKALRIKVRSAQPPRVRGGETATRKRPPSA